ncbi:type II toxin-antitoxin system RatA family toxin [Paraferrimonas sp. SM1919]|uniref:type II toxin-antitoxin system RatA family toxin n=1 Tax=Paraferrimonas sp. SM1919 TaxID=2662263 RepID=UPI0013D01AD1|nr:type II toxin-antitoxin system RatA family toxin [Paraferrimonas sp. SM1919]
MATVNRNALVAQSATRMYNLVNDVASYPQFLPGCSATTVHQHNETMMLASVEVSKAGIKHTFKTENKLNSHQSIEMSLIEGPFKHLKGEWKFTPLSENACKVELNLDFEFSSKLVELAFGKIFNELANSMVTAFCERAKVIYGR